MSASIGQRFGRWVVVSAAPRIGREIALMCVCDCGVRKAIRSYSLTNGDSRSCGCGNADATKKRFTKHGMFGTHTYESWAHMIQRCTNNKAKAWRHYGGRGIKVCDRWRSFDLFFADMGICPDRLTIERIDVNGNYEPNNCKWATQKEQQRNRRNTKLNDEKAAQIRKMCASGHAKRDVAAMFCVCRSTVQKVVSLALWA